MVTTASRMFDRARLTAKRVPYVRRLAWRSGRLAHHTYPTLRRRARATGGTETAARSNAAAIHHRGTAVPSYPYPETPDEPLALEPAGGCVNPVLTAADVTDYGAVDYVADPFLYVTGAEEWHMFFEVFNREATPDAAIGHATSPDGGLHWEYDGIVLKTDEHLSFPYVFAWNGTHYMVPEAGGPDGTTVTLYEAVEFPRRWRPVATPVSSDHGTDDTVVFRWEDRWWAIVGDSVYANRLHVYHSDSLVADDWTPHAGNPVVTDRPAATRPAGRPIVREDRILVFYQDCTDRYGGAVRAFEITDLSPTTYVDRPRLEAPLLAGTGDRFGWNSGAMHHVDPWYTGEGWRCAVDGNVGFGRSVLSDQHWAIGMYVSAE
ncbi:glucosamine inositolphosphorylceramide transferase family protein [Natrononativus amylolyticus]|uniref:glucosamine inositolphosphorylceramide transferase family protein n=1 Tax=Natrononativus amylolyticus TaxID=2963434 RepID=UPI0020CE2B7D|nr:hypothetical protein [Natrononativus amylolyticus]